MHMYFRNDLRVRLLEQVRKIKRIRYFISFLFWHFIFLLKITLMLLTPDMNHFCRNRQYVKNSCLLQQARFRGKPILLIFPYNNLHFESFVIIAINNKMLFYSIPKFHSSNVYPQYML